jgi:putative holliday junction resolvase
LPLHMDGGESAMAKQARRVAERLAGVLPVPVDMHDERLTSVAAEERLAARGWTLKRLLAEKKKGAVDQMAARILLEDWLTRRGGVEA